MLGLHPSLAPIKAAVFALTKKDGMPEMAHRIANDLRQHFPVDYDETGSIGKRYRRQDEVGTPFCITVDGESVKDGTVTVRDRDTLKQDRIAADALRGYLSRSGCGDERRRCRSSACAARARRSWRSCRASTIAAHAGLKATRGAAADLREAREILGRDALELARETFARQRRGERGAALGAAAARLAGGVAERRASCRRSTSARSRGRATRSCGSADGREIPYQRAAIEHGQQHGPRERATIETARARSSQRELAPMRRERFQRERDITESLGSAPTATSRRGSC